MQPILYRCIAALLAASLLSPAILAAEQTDLDARIEEKREAARLIAAKVAQEQLAASERAQARIASQLEELRAWTTTELDHTASPYGDELAPLPTLINRWREQDASALSRFLEYPESSHGAIESGRALNALLAKVGTAAAQNQVIRRNSSAGEFPLHPFLRDNPVSGETHRHVSLASSTTGPSDVRRGNAALIGVDWPPLLLEDPWKSHRTKIELLREEALEELATTQGLTEATESDLREAVSNLNTAFQKHCRDWHDNRLSSTTVAAEFHEIYVARQHIRRLIASVYYASAIQSFYNVSQRPPFEGGDIEAYLAYLSDNDLRFAPAAVDADRQSYHVLFRLMSRYYHDLQSLASLRYSLERELSVQQKRGELAANTAMGRVLSAPEVAEVAKESMQLLRDVLKE